MVTVSIEEYTEMRHIFRVFAEHFRREERAERAKATNGPSSMVEAQQAGRTAEMNRVYAEAAEKYAEPE